MDAHYATECVMLTKCPLCHYLVEIVKLAAHQATECEKGGPEKYKNCDQCLLGYTTNSQHECDQKPKCCLCLQVILEE